jgi:hypothetical protein
MEPALGTRFREGRLLPGQLVGLVLELAAGRTDPLCALEQLKGSGKRRHHVRRVARTELGLRAALPQQCGEIELLVWVGETPGSDPGELQN